MPNNTGRTIVIFSIIALILGGAVVGGVRLLKSRNNSYATTQTQPSQPAPQTSPAQPEQPKPSSSGDTNQTAVPPSTTQPEQAQAQPSPTPPASSTPSNSEVAATGPQTMAATGPAEVGISIVVLMAATFFGGQLLRARASYRRYLNSHS